MGPPSSHIYIYMNGSFGSFLLINFQIQLSWMASISMYILFFVASLIGSILSIGVANTNLSEATLKRRCVKRCRLLKNLPDWQRHEQTRCGRMKPFGLSKNVGGGILSGFGKWRFIVTSVVVRASPLLRVLFFGKVVR